MCVATAVESRRERRIAARKRQILAAAAVVFSHKGYAGATTREIAETADVSEGTLYNYFGSKQELLVGVAEAYAQDVVQTIATLKANTMKEIMAQLLAARFRSGRERRLFMVFLSEARLNPDIDHTRIQAAFCAIIQETEKRLQTAVASGQMRPIDLAVAARTISATIMGFGALFELGGMMWEGLTPPGDGTFSPEQLGQTVADIFLHGLEVRESGHLSENFVGHE